ncbi:MAG: hypothetical protein AB7I30_02740, partial [Isosphaeraceae bacterium]
MWPYYRASRYATVLLGSLAAWLSFDLATAQKLIFILTLGWIVFRIFFVSDLIGRFVVGNLVVVSLIVGFYAMLVGLLGSTYGVMNLFWHQDLAARIVAAFFSTLFFALMFLIAFYADPNREATRDRLKAYLEDDRSLTQIVKDNVEAFRGAIHSVIQWFRERGWRNPPAPVPAPEPDGDQRASAQDDVKRFFSVFFYPFWLLLLLPAVCPAVYPYIPRQLPTKLAALDLAWPPPAENDVTTRVLTWLVGIAIWGAGLLAGRFFIWSYVEVNRRLFGTLTPESRTDPTLRSVFDRLIGWVCHLPDEAWGKLEGEEPSAKVDLQRAIIRFTTALFTIYGLAVLFNVLLSDRGHNGVDSSRSSNDAIAFWSWVGGGLFAVSFGAMAWFLRCHAWDLRQEYRGSGSSRFYRRGHAIIALLMAIGLALSGLRSAVFQVFLFLAILATLELIINRLSRSWNWPIEAVPVSALLALALVGWLWWANSSPSKLRLPGIETYYEEGKRRPIQDVLDRDVEANPMDDDAVFQKWRAFTGKEK